ncbi:hypothetical protein [Bradyrhizobium sp. 2S1]|uniref:hypothetical protein n=1 Tax=Bradyrhizobium sp. 2S1 TaxID=1404429 RepID=UPI00140A349E|nr:hypothetical protein [Bradyrhizobium sp. 2S1]MCK7664470.1 hypothetical protein [Bradyrhizobium sp. 2S1]
MNHSIYSTDRATHMKIVAAALVASIGVAGFGIAVRINTDNEYSRTAQVIKIKARHQERKLAVALPTP